MNKELNFKILKCFFTCPIIYWAGLRVLYLNEIIEDFTFFYHFLPTLFLMLIFLIVFYVKKNIFENYIFIIVTLSLILTNIESQIFEFCEPQKNAPTIILTTILIINSIFLILYLFFINTKKNLSLPFTLIFCVFIILNNWFYVHSIFRIFDSLILGW